MVDDDRIFRAVQERAAAFLMDWPVVNSLDVPDMLFTGTVFILSEDGDRVADVPWIAPTDGAADEGLQRIGWTRRGRWETDEYGRRSALMTPPGRSQQRTLLPTQGGRERQPRATAEKVDSTTFYFW